MAMYEWHLLSVCVFYSYFLTIYVEPRYNIAPFSRAIELFTLILQFIPKYVNKFY